MRFVILHHEFPDSHPRQSHWDFMLEWEPEVEGGNTLKTWALEHSPLETLAELRAEGTNNDSDRESETAPEAEIPAIRLEDHREHYLTYEGPVSNDRGRVSRIASGIYRVIEETETETIVELAFGMDRGKASGSQQKKFTVRVPRCEPGQRLGLIVGLARRDSS